MGVLIVAQRLNKIGGRGAVSRGSQYIAITVRKVASTAQKVHLDCSRHPICLIPTFSRQKQNIIVPVL